MKLVWTTSSMLVDPTHRAKAAAIPNLGRADDAVAFMASRHPDEAGRRLTDAGGAGRGGPARLDLHFRFGPFRFMGLGATHLPAERLGAPWTRGDFWMIRLIASSEIGSTEEAAPELSRACEAPEPSEGGAARPRLVLIFDAEAVGVRPRADRALKGAAGAVFSEHLRLLDRLLPVSDDAEREFLAEATQALLAALFSRRAPQAVAVADSRAALRRAKVEQVIRSNIASARLDASRICALSGVSRASLYRLFSESGGVARHVRMLRLTMIHADLANPARAHESISMIAERHGLHCASSFSRSFRRVFGRAPGEVRAEALSDTTELPPQLSLP